MEQLQTLLATNKLRLTSPRLAVFEALQQAEKPLYLHEINAACKQIDRTSVYRNLEQFSRLGIIEIIHTGWKKRYELASPYKPHHHHIQCTSCGELIAIDTPQLEGIIQDIATAYDHKLSSHHIELHGICSHCQNKAK